MASQTITTKPLSGSTLGVLKYVNSSDSENPTVIHSSGDDTAVQHAVFGELRNNSDAPVLVHVYWMPIADYESTNAYMSFLIPPYSSELLSAGYRVGADGELPPNVIEANTVQAVAAWLDDSGDQDKVTFRGQINVVDQPLT